jgi:hypothetical protein
MRSTCGDFALANSISEEGEDKRLLSTFKTGEIGTGSIDVGLDLKFLSLSQGF